MAVDEQLEQAALDYHRYPTAGKISVQPTKSLTNQRDLALAYSPGVAAACMAIARDPLESRTLTSRGNLVAVVSNGTAVLGLGNIGALAGKPVMEGKGCLFKKFAGIDVFDIEIAETDADKIVAIVAALEPTFGGINLEDIKAPECFEIERKLRERMKIPVFHDDQHGTAIVTAAAVLNGLKVVGKEIAEAKLVCSGAGAAAIACVDLLVGLGLAKEHVLLCDSKGVVYQGRGAMDPQKLRYAQPTEARTLADIIPGSDIFLGLSAAGVLKPEMVRTMADRPLILALANPDPEIRPEIAKAARPDCVIATGRSDYPNQVNNVLCFPFIFRGALDVGATTINEAMKRAATEAIAELARAEPSDVVAAAYGTRAPQFGPEYLIPAPFDPRLITTVAPAVARAAMDSGVATRPIADLRVYRDQLRRYVYRSGTIMQPVFAAAAAGQASRRVVYAEGEDERVLRAAQIVVDERLARPVLVGHTGAIERKIAELGLRFEIGRDAEVTGPEDETLIADAASAYYRLGRRRGLTRDQADAQMRSSGTVLGAMLVRQRKADGMLCGTTGSYQTHLKPVAEIVGLREGVSGLAAMNLLMLPRQTVFICDTYINVEPSAEQIVEMIRLAAEEVRRFGLVPRVALLSHSSFGSSNAASAARMREALALIEQSGEALEVEGEMHGDAALSKQILDQTFPDARLSAEANLLIMPNLDASNITYNVLKVVAGEGVTVGPILLGAARPVHILTPTSTVRRIVNMTALVAVESGILNEVTP